MYAGILRKKSKNRIGIKELIRMLVKGIVTRNPVAVKVGKSPFATEKVLLILVVDRKTDDGYLIDFYRAHLSGEQARRAKYMTKGTTVTITGVLTADNGATKHINVEKILHAEVA